MHANAKGNSRVIITTHAPSHTNAAKVVIETITGAEFNRHSMNE